MEKRSLYLYHTFREDGQPLLGGAFYTEETFTLVVLYKIDISADTAGHRIARFLAVCLAMSSSYILGDGGWLCCPH